MKALVAQELSEPAGRAYSDVEDPADAAPNDEMVVVDVGAAGVSFPLFEFGVAELVKAGLKPPPPVRFPLSKGADALQSLADGGVFDKVVLEPWR
jgi:hypothetical protein